MCALPPLTRPVPVLSVVALLLLLLEAVSVVRAQAPAVTGLDLEAPDADLISESDIEAALESAQQSASLADEDKQAITEKYNAASKFLRAAEADRERLGRLRERLAEEPDAVAGLTKELEELTARGAPEKPGDREEVSTADLQEELQAKRSEQVELQSMQQALEKEIAALRLRVGEIALRTPDARTELAEAERELASSGEPSSPMEAAEAALLKAKVEALRAEIATLQAERDGQEALERLANANMKVLEVKVDRVSTQVSQMEEFLSRRRQTELDQLRERLANLQEARDSISAALEPKLDEIEDLISELGEASRLLRRTENKHNALRTELAALSNSYDIIQRQLAIGGRDDIVSQSLVDILRNMPSRQQLDFSQKQRSETMREIRLAEMEIDEKSSEQLGLEENKEGLSPAELDLISLRREVLDDLELRYRTLARELANNSSVERAYENKVRQVGRTLETEIFWRRTAPPLGMESILAVPQAFQWVFKTERWKTSWNAIKRIPQQSPGLTLLFGIVFVVLIALRPWIVRMILESGNYIRRISRDRFSSTLIALSGSILLTLPWVLLAGFLGWSLQGATLDPSWIRGLGLGVSFLSVLGGAGMLLHIICRSGGLGPEHLGWNEAVCQRIRQSVRLVIIPYIPACLIISSTLYETTSEPLNTAGRIVLIIYHLWLAFAVWRCLRPGDGIFAEIIRNHPERLLVRLRYSILAIVIAIPAGIAVLAFTGYILTSIMLSVVFFGSFGILGFALLLHGLILRWFTIRERKFALAEAIKERQANREQVVLEECGTEIVIGDDELKVDALITQTKRLLRSLTIIALIVVLFIYWNVRLPFDEALDTTNLIGDITLLNVFQIILLFAVFGSLYRNLPGMLELAGLRARADDAGLRYAITSICQYLVIALGVIFITALLGVKWSQFGWIAAALSVGIGFGLQEIISNFVCGLILLFERPIRVGDVVSVNGTVGTVTRIQIRATTLTNWDRQELIIPNKDLVTGSVINWTLGDSITRTVIQVGVAYGSDVQKAKEILVRIAQENPNILDDPAPFATFEEFGDSTLNLYLRYFLPDISNLLGTKSEVHERIDEEFKAAGIEIAFPQRDLHLRSIDAATAERLSASNNGKFASAPAHATGESDGDGDGDGEGEGNGAREREHERGASALVSA